MIISKIPEKAIYSNGRILSFFRSEFIDDGDLEDEIYNLTDQDHEFHDKDEEE